MTSFTNGPAKGQHLMLKRAPLFLRVVVADGVKGQQWDALDQVDDVPKLGERLFAYRRTGEVGMCHIHARHGAGGCFTIATYSHVEPPPAEADMRDTAAWRTWCKQHAAS